MKNEYQYIAKIKLISPSSLTVFCFKIIIVIADRAKRRLATRRRRFECREIFGPNKNSEVFIRLTFSIFFSFFHKVKTYYKITIRCERGYNPAFWHFLGKISPLFAYYRFEPIYIKQGKFPRFLQYIK